MATAIINHKREQVVSSCKTHAYKKWLVVDKKDVNQLKTRYIGENRGMEILDTDQICLKLFGGMDDEGKLPQDKNSVQMCITRV